MKMRKDCLEKDEDQQEGPWRGERKEEDKIEWCVCMIIAKHTPGI